jgi:hypothetical protein
VGTIGFQGTNALTKNYILAKWRRNQTHPVVNQRQRTRRKKIVASVEKNGQQGTDVRTSHNRCACEKLTDAFSCFGGFS